MSTKLKTWKLLFESNFDLNIQHIFGKSSLKSLPPHWAHVNYSLRLRWKCTFHIWRKSTIQYWWNTISQLSSFHHRELLIHQIWFLKTGKQANVRDAIAIAEVDQLKVGTNSDKKKGESWYISSDIVMFQRCLMMYIQAGSCGSRMTRRNNLNSKAFKLTWHLSWPPDSSLRRTSADPQWEKKKQTTTSHQCPLQSLCHCLCLCICLCLGLCH